jgi:uncharacterized protein (TIGR02145 family)
MKKTTMTMMLLVAIIVCTAQPGSFSNVTATQRTDGSALVDINFDLSGPALTYYISLEVSFNDGANYWPISASAISGDVQISAGTGYSIVWDALQSHPNRFSDESKIMLVATAASTLNPCPGTPNVTDIDGNVYNTVLIGTQCWMKENLRTTRFRDGFSVQPWHYWYNHDISYKYQYGGLYHWHAVNSGHGLCPEGWHVPTQAEWNALVSYVPGGSSYHLKSCRQVGSPLGGDCDTEDHPRWDQHASVYGIDDHGFSAQPGGWRSSNFATIGKNGFWWTSEPTGDKAYYRSMETATHVVSSSSANQDYYLSVRCIQTGE